LKQQLAETEYEVQQVLSERGSVLKENQNLSDKNESLRKEMDKVLKSRDEYVKECEGLRQKLQVLRSQSEFLHSNDDLYSSKEKMSTLLSLEVANQEIEKLKKLLEKVNLEKVKAIQESDVAKSRRDWAIIEREKIVQERDSVRNLCDELRRERDTATSKLLAAIRDKDEAFKRIEQLNEKLEMLSNVKKINDTHDIQKKSRTNDIEEEIEVEVSPMMVNPNFGITLECANENSDYNGNPYYPQVVYVDPNSVFYGKLHTNDFIRYVNGIDCSNLSQRAFFKNIRTGSHLCKMQIRRTKPALNGIYNIQLQISNNTNHGILFENGIYIANIEPNSAAYYEPLLSVGDRVLQINEKSLEGIKNMNELNQILMNVGNSEKLLLKIMKNGMANDGMNASTLNKGWSRMANQSTQTDHSDLKRSMEMSSFLPIVPFIPPPTAHDQEVSMMNASISSSSPNSSKSSSKFTAKNMLQKLRDKISNTNKDIHENDAIAELDLVLESQDSLDAAPEKSKNKSKYKKNIAKSWPRAAMGLHDSGKSHSGTVVFSKKKERPKLFHFSTDDQPNSQDDRKDSEKISAEQQKAVDSLFLPPPPPVQTTTLVKKTNQFMRSNLVTPRSTLPSSQSGKSPVYMHPIYEPKNSGNKNFHANRLSLNLSNAPSKAIYTPSPNTFIPIKASSSIESKSPLDHEEIDFASQKHRYLNNYSASKSNFYC
jgi:discs large protein 5